MKQREKTNDSVDIPGIELLDLLSKMDAVVALILETDVNVDLQVALLDLRDSSKKLADKMDDPKGV